MENPIADEIRQSLMGELANIEKKTDLTRLTVLSRSGMKVATSDSMTIELDSTAASSAALIEVGIRFNSNVQHGSLREILIRGKSGYAILMYIDSDYMIFAGLANLARIGYYLEFLRMKCRMLSFILAGGKITDDLRDRMKVDKIKSGEAEPLAQTFESDKSQTEDISAMQDVLNFLNDWGSDEEAESPEQINSGIVNISDDYLVDAKDIVEENIESKVVKKTEIEFTVYDDEVPPIPLDDVEALELKSESSEAEQVSQTAPEEVVEQDVSEISQVSIDEEGEPNFDQITAEEYEDIDLDFSEDEAMFDALNDLGYIDKDTKEKKKK